MTRDEAAKLLEISPRASRRQCDAAYAKTLGVLTLRLQHETVPNERDVLGRGIRLLGEAYQVFTGAPPPTQVTASKPGKATKSPPKVRLGPPVRQPPAPPPPPPAPRRSILNKQPAAAKSRPPAAAAKRPPARPPARPSGPPPAAASPDPIAARAWAAIAAIVLLAVAFVYGATK